MGIESPWRGLVHCHCRRNSQQLYHGSRDPGGQVSLFAFATSRLVDLAMLMAFQDYQVGQFYGWNLALILGQFNT